MRQPPEPSSARPGGPGHPLREEPPSRKEIVRAAYDQQAARYADHTRLQGGNLGRLLDRLGAAAGGLPAGAWLDVGAGTGQLAQRLVALGTLSGATRYTGVDLSPAMIAAARASFSSSPLAHAAHAVTFAVADAEALPFPDARFDTVVSNSVLHWLHDPQVGRRPDAAVAELARVAAPGGWVAVSVAAVGTARRFQRAYHAALAETRGEGLAMGPVRRDPIGCLALHEVVDALARAGLEVVHADTLYEPVSYPSPAIYAADVAAYGFGVYMAPVPQARRTQVWARVVAAFEAQEGPGPYLHDQYMGYAVARRACTAPPPAESRQT